MVSTINPSQTFKGDQFGQIMKHSGFTNAVATYSGVSQSLHARTTSSGKTKTESLTTESMPRYLEKFLLKWMPPGK